LKEGKDIEALAINKTGVLYAASGDDTDKPGHLFNLGLFLFMEIPNKIVDRPHFMLDGVYKSPKSNHDKGLFSERRVILTHHFALLI